MGAKRELNLTLALSLDRHARAAIAAHFGGTRPGRWDRLTVTAVDSANKIATCTTVAGVTVYAMYVVVLPAVGEAWLAHKKPDGSYLLVSVAR